MILKILLQILLSLSLFGSAFAATDYCASGTAQLCLPMTTGSGTTLVDQSSVGNDAQFLSSGNPAWDSTDIVEDASAFVGDSGGWSTDYTSDYATTDSKVTNLGISYNCTVVVWVRPTNTSGTYGILSQANSSTDRMTVGIIPTNTIAAGKYNGSTMYTKSGATTGVNTWQHYAFTFTASGSVPALWVDGVSKTGGGWPNTHSTSNNAHIGSRSDGGTLFPGNIDELAVFTDVKDSTDINDIMDNGLVQASTFKPFAISY